MGGCVSSPSSSSSSSSSTSLKHSTAKVVTLKGEIAEYKVPVIVSQVLVHQLQAQGQGQEEAPSWFLCNSDSLLFDDYIPALDLEDELEADQIYFVLPTSKLQYKLSASDMAALAVKASLALQNASTIIINLNNSRKKIKTNPPAATARNRISPSPAFDSQFHHQKPVSRPNFGVSRSDSVRKFQRCTSRRAKLAIRSFRLRLTTIYEGIVM